MKPFLDMILIRAEQTEKTRGGVYLPEQTSFKLGTGEVLEVGPGTVSANGFAVEVNLCKGNRVLFEKTRCLRLCVNGEDLWVSKPHNIIAVLDPADKIDLQ